VRPPGHHAEACACHGFSFFNNVALAAAVARKRLGVKRVLIVDWDVHHGNGTQRFFEADASVMFIDLHRWQNGNFYPFMQGAGPASVGCGAGAGATINIAWNSTRMGDGDYLEAFRRVVMPAARCFDPELVLVSCGLDAAEGDTGYDHAGEMALTPAGYAQMTSHLMELAKGRLVVALEGGYNLHSISQASVSIVATLLGDTTPQICPQPSREGLRDIEATLAAHAALYTAPGECVDPRLRWATLPKEPPCLHCEDCQDCAAPPGDKLRASELLLKKLEEEKTLRRT